MEQKTKKMELTEQEARDFEEFKRAREKKEAAQNAKRNREEYRSMVDVELASAIPYLLEISGNLAKAKTHIFSNFKAILDMKSDIMKLTKDGQRSHTFTSKDGIYRLTLGRYTIDSYDDTVESGIAIVKEYLESLARNDETKELVSMIMRLLSTDGAGNLKANRVIQLRQLAENSENDRFIEGVKIIEEAYKPTDSKMFIRAEKRGENGEWVNIPLGMTDV